MTENPHNHAGRWAVLDADGRKLTRWLDRKAAEAFRGFREDWRLVREGDGE